MVNHLGLCFAAATVAGLIVGGGILTPDAAQQEFPTEDLVEAGGFGGATFVGCVSLTN